MNTNSKTLIQFTNLTITIAGHSILKNVSGAISSGDKIGLIGINGSGKTSLLKVLANLAKQEAGTIQQTGKVVYVPQLDFDQLREQVPVYEYISRSHEQWWQSILLYQQIFSKRLAENTLISNLSGGELVKLNIAIAMTQEPDLILLDEPTNHLDLNSLEQLKELLIQTQSAYILVSHNIDFLNQVADTIWELDEGKINIFGGNYNFYKAEKSKLITAQEAEYEVAKKELRKQKLALNRANKVYDRTQSKLKRMARENDRSIPRIARNAIKLKVQETFGSTKVKKEESIEKTEQKLSELKLLSRKNAYLEIQANLESGLLISILNGNLILPTQDVLISDLNLTIYKGERLGILGDNGSGKTTLIKQLEYLNHPLLTGKINYGKAYLTVYLDQQYDLVQPKLSLLENIKAINNQLSYQEIRRVLGNMNFWRDEQVHKLASELSGGETARLAFAMVTLTQVDLLILDEPTNNLDIETKEVIGQSLASFKGTIIIISHDLEFMNRIGIEKYYEIDGCRLKLTSAIP